MIKAYEVIKGTFIDDDGNEQEISGFVSIPKSCKPVFLPDNFFLKKGFYIRYDGFNIGYPHQLFEYNNKDYIIASNDVNLFPTEKEWTSCVGNYLRYIYYDPMISGDTGNPSESAGNVKYINYYRGDGVLCYRIHLKYNENDDVIFQQNQLILYQSKDNL